MPLFGHRKSDSIHEDDHVREPERKGSIFSKRSSTPPESPTRNSNDRGHRVGGLFGGHKDPSILAAREKVKLAEEAEQAADKALIAARKAVTEARDNVRNLELEADEDARLAKVKQEQARGIRKSAKGLGKHDK